MPQGALVQLARLPAEQGGSAAAPYPMKVVALPGNVPDWLDECVNPDGVRTVEGGDQFCWVSWNGRPGLRTTIVLDGEFTLPQLRELVAMMERDE